MSASLKGKSVVVTGSSKGIGKGMARVFARHEAKVLIVARHLNDADATARELSKGGATVSAFAADVTRLSDMEAMAMAAVDRYGGLDVLCANAGIFPQRAGCITGQTIVVDGGQILPESLEALAPA